jgi:hypothetical protein
VSEKNEIKFKLPDNYYEALQRLAKSREISINDMAKLLLIDKIEEELFLENVRKKEVE